MNNLQSFDTNQRRSPSFKGIAETRRGESESVPTPRELEAPELFRQQSELLGTRSLRGLELILAELQVPDLIVGALTGELDFRQLHEAAARVQARHPGLRVLVERSQGKRPRFKYYSPDASRVDVSVVGSDEGLSGEPSRPRWQRVAEREAAHRFDLTQGFGFRVVWVPSGAGGHLIVNAPHAVVDGVSLMRLLNEMLEELANVQAGHLPEVVALAPTPAVLDQVQLGPIEALIGRVAKHVTLYQQRTYARRSLLPIESQLAPGDLPRAAAVFHIGATQSYEDLLLSCKRKAVTVGCLFTAAVQFAVVRYIREETGRIPTKGSGVKLPISMDFSLRRLIDGASRTQSSIGLFTGVADVGLSVSRDVTLWELAREFVVNSREQIERRIPLLFHKALDSMLDLAASLRSYGVSYEASGGAADGVNVSSVGAYPYPNQHGGLQLEHVFGMNGALNGGPMLIFWLRSVNGHFCYNATAATPACSRATVERLMSYVVEIMENAAGAGFERLTLNDYASELPLR